MSSVFIILVSVVRVVRVVRVTMAMRMKQAHSVTSRQLAVCSAMRVVRSLSQRSVVAETGGQVAERIGAQIDRGAIAFGESVIDNREMRILQPLLKLLQVVLE